MGSRIVFSSARISWGLLDVIKKGEPKNEVLSKELSKRLRELIKRIVKLFEKA